MWFKILKYLPLNLYFLCRLGRQKIVWGAEWEVRRSPGVLNPPPEQCLERQLGQRKILSQRRLGQRKISLRSRLGHPLFKQAQPVEDSLFALPGPNETFLGRRLGRCKNP